MKPHIEQVFKRNVELAAHTTFRIGGPARYFCEARSADDVREAVSAANEAGLAWYVIGGGSNILANDDHLDRAVIAFKNDTYPQINDHGTITVSGGAPLRHFVACCAEYGRAGPESLVGIPGTVGGAIAGHAGAYGVTIATGLRSVRLLTRDGTLVTEDANELAFDYRTSRLKQSGDIVLEATFELPRGDPAQVVARLAELLEDRRAKHPDYTKIATAGSFFKNLPPKPGETRRRAAGELLDHVGAKNLRKGDAAIWHNHANIVINYGTATARDVKDLADEMATRVHERFGVVLEPEVTFLD